MRRCSPSSARRVGTTTTPCRRARDLGHARTPWPRRACASGSATARGRRATVVGRPGGMVATMPRERHHERGPLRAGTRRCGRGATTRAPSAPASRSPGGTSDGSLTGAARGGGNAPDGARRQRPPGRRGNAAVVVGPYGASLKPPATPGDLYSLPKSGDLGNEGCQHPRLGTHHDTSTHSPTCVQNDAGPPPGKPRSPSCLIVLPTKNLEESYSTPRLAIASAT